MTRGTKLRQERVVSGPLSPQVTTFLPLRAGKRKTNVVAGMTGRRKGDAADASNCATRGQTQRAVGLRRSLPVSSNARVRRSCARALRSFKIAWRACSKSPAANELKKSRTALFP